MLYNYLPVLIFLGVATGIGLLLMGLGVRVGRGDIEAERLSPYECGVEAVEESRV
jgi:NADH-quinone oxidoreductase subunit A